MNECKEIQTWLTGIDAKPKTRGLYSKTVQGYCDFLGLPGDQIIKKYIGEIKEGLLMPERSVFHDIPLYLDSLKQRNLAPKSTHTYKAAVISFLKYYYIEVPNIKNGKVRTLEDNTNRFLTRDQVKHVLDYAIHIRNKAMILMQATSGMAANEILNLKIGQITFDKDKVGTVKLRREKVQHDYFTFISPESTKTLKEYWKGRERNIDRKLVKSDYAFVTKDENQINTQVFMNFFQDLARRAGYEKGTKKRYCDIRSHAFRKFFSSTMQQDGMKKDDVDALLGHVPDGTDQAYFSNDIDILKEKYIKHLPAITLAETIEINTVDAEQFEAQAAELAELRAAQKKSEEREREIDAQLTAIQELLKLGAMHNIKT